MTKRRNATVVEDTFVLLSRRWGRISQAKSVERALDWVKTSGKKGKRLEKIDEQSKSKITREKGCVFTPTVSLFAGMLAAKQQGRFLQVAR